MHCARVLLDTIAPLECDVAVDRIVVVSANHNIHRCALPRSDIVADEPVSQTLPCLTASR